jgi:hypothetical protein
MSGIKDVAKSAIGTAAVVAHASLGGPEITATDRYTTAVTTDTTTSETCEADEEAPNYYEGRPVADFSRRQIR